MRADIIALQHNTHRHAVAATTPGLPRHVVWTDLSSQHPSLILIGSIVAPVATLPLTLRGRPILLMT